MIYTVTFNPSLDYIVSVSDFKLGLTNRTDSELLLPGGKGIMFRRSFKTLELPIRRLALLPGLLGEEDSEGSGAAGRESRVYFPG